MEYKYTFGCKNFKGLVGNAGSPLCRKQTTVGRFARTSLLFLFMLCSMVASAQQMEVTLTEAGTLSEEIASDQKYSTTSLKVSGPINGTDVRYLREMAGRDVKGSNTDGKLVDLDLTNANIVEGGGWYCRFSSSYYTENNTIGNSMFFNCKLQSIKLPNSVTSIGQDAFRYCSSLTSITIPNSVTSIGSWVFCGCSGLTSITIGNSVTSIGKSAFWECKSLTSVTIPNSVTSIGDYAFLECKRLISVTIPNSVTSIGHSAFSGCKSLTSVTIPNSVTSIGESAFSDCAAIVKLVSLNTTPPTCYTYAFYGIDKRRCTLYVPKNSLDAYKAVDQWNDFYNIEGFDPTDISLPGSNGTNKVVKRYDANGRLIGKPAKGLNVLKMSDGTIKKVLVK